MKPWFDWRIPLLAAATLCPAAIQASTPRNVVLIVADDLGLDLGCYGSPIRTPNLDTLASQGTRFDRAFCTTSSCSASRSVILTGLHNHANGQFGHQHLPANFHTFNNLKSLPLLLSNAGYRTAAIGKMHVQPESVYHFDQILPHQTPGAAHNPVGMANDARAFLAQSSNQPFFLYFCPTDPHRAGQGFANDKNYPGVQPVSYDPSTLTPPPFLPDSPEARQEWAEYAQAVTRLDQGVGQLLHILDTTGLADSTLVLFLSDNGVPFPGAKTTLYEAGTKLPLIVRAPNHPNPGSVSPALVSWVDVVPTILEFTGTKPPAYPLHGQSFLSRLGRQDPGDRDHLFFSHTFHEIQMYYPMRAIRGDRFKLIFNIAHPLPFPFASDLHDSKTWQALLQRGDPLYGPRSVQAYIHRPRFELYDLLADPLETHNQADDPAHAKTLAELQARLQAFQRETSDPWLSKWNYE